MKGNKSLNWVKTACFMAITVASLSGAQAQQNLTFKIDFRSEPLAFREKTLELDTFQRPLTFKTDGRGQAWVWLVGLPTHMGNMEFYVRSVEFNFWPANRKPTVVPGAWKPGNSLRLPF